MNVEIETTPQSLGFKQKTHVKVNKKMWKRISGWLIWDDISISGDKLILTIKFGEVGVALRAFRYYTTGSDPHGERSENH